MRIGKTLALGGALALFLAVSGTVASAANLLVNPDFETGDLSGWVVAGGNASAVVTVVGTENGPSAAGTQSAFLNNQSEAVGLTLKQTTTPGDPIAGTVFYSFDLKLGRAELGGVFFVEIFAEKTGVGIVGGSGLLGNYAPANWTTIDGSFEAPVGTDFLTIQFTAVTGAVVGGSSSMYVDNVSLSNQGPVSTESMNWGSLKSQHQ